MPSPGDKNRRKKTKKSGSTQILAPQSGEGTPSGWFSSAAPHTTPANSETSGTQCCTLLEDETTRCGEPATAGKPGERRCQVHHAQYLTMYKAYKAASSEVDEIKNSGQFPTSNEITSMKELSEVLQTLRWLNSYVEAIRVERYGRKIHSGRFFLKVDAGHRKRINILAKEMERVNSLRRELGRQAIALSPKIGRPGTNVLDDRYASANTHSNVDTELRGEFERTREAIVNADEPFLDRFFEPNDFTRGNSALEYDDLIEQSMDLEKHKLLALFEPMVESEGLPAPYADHATLEESEEDIYISRVGRVAMSQYLRRAAFYDDELYCTTLDKVSFRDWLLSPEFTLEDAMSIVAHQVGMTGFGLLWLKDAVHEAVEIVRRGDKRITAQLGRIDNRIDILGGWIYNQKYSGMVSDEVWWHLYEIADIEPNTEHRMVRLCNTFDDLTGFLSVAAFRIPPDPPRYPPGRLASSVPRMHLSLSGVIIADMVSPPPLSLVMPPKIPTTIPPKYPGNIVWGEQEFRSHMFGAVRHDKDDPFTKRFLAELRSRPDLFQLVIWDETKSDATVHEFGSGKKGKALPQMRAREFESLYIEGETPTGHGPWNVFHRSAQDVLFSPAGDPSKGQIAGYITMLRRQEQGQFFRFKSPSIPVRYIVILDTTPNRDVAILSVHVAWMALRAGGYATGEFTPKKYCEASDRLYEVQAKQRLSWQPSFFDKWVVTKMEPEDFTLWDENGRVLERKMPTRAKSWIRYVILAVAAALALWVTLRFWRR